MIRFCSLFILFVLLQNQVQAKNFNVIEFGARGDDNLDDTKSFQLAIASLKNGDRLYVPEGTFLVSSLLIKNRSNVKFYGEGIIRAVNKQSPYFINILNCPNIFIEGLTFDCLFYKNIGIDVQDSPNGKVSQVIVKNVKGKDSNWSTGVRIGKASDFFSIVDSYIDKIYSDREAAIGIWIVKFEAQKASYGVNIKNVEVSNISSPKDADGIKVQQLFFNSHLCIENCTFINTKKRAIKIQTNGVIIRNNTIRRTEEYGVGFSVFSIYGGDVDVLNNRFSSYGNSSVTMFLDVSSYSNIKIVNNRFENSILSKSSVVDFLNITHNTSEKSLVSEYIYVYQNFASNLRYFVFINSSVKNIMVKNNTVQGLKRNLVNANGLSKIGSISIDIQRNMVKTNNADKTVFRNDNLQLKDVSIVKSNNIYESSADNK